MTGTCPYLFFIVVSHKNGASIYITVYFTGKISNFKNRQLNVMEQRLLAGFTESVIKDYYQRYGNSLACIPKHINVTIT